jgi:transposase-like protein
VKKLTTPDLAHQVRSCDLTLVLRARVRQAIEAVIEEELASALGCERGERSADRAGFRHGDKTRDVLTEYGPAELTIPRGRLFDAGGKTSEWHSSVLPRYQRRTRRVDEALLGSYLAGGNTRRLRTALAPLLGDNALSRSSISRITVRLRALFDEWRSRDLSQESLAVVYFDGIYLPVRLARRVVKVPVLVALGVREDGQKLLVALQLVSGETTVGWASLISDLARRGLSAPVVAVVDGNAGLLRAMRKEWPQVKIQRCIKHKWENLKTHTPKHAHREMKRDYDAIVMAENHKAASLAYASFVRKWTPLCEGAVRSLDEAGTDLLTYYEFPRSQWKCLRTTNPLERLNGEFRRRTKTQGSFREESSALVLLWGLVAFGQIVLRKIDGWKDMTRTLKMSWKEAA